MGKKKDKKKKESKALVKMAARDLGLKYHKGQTVGDLIRSEADRIVRQSAASTGIDSDANQWRGITQSRRDLQPIEQDRLIEIANFLVTQNPLGNKIRKTRRDFVIGDGITVEAEDTKVIQPIIDSFFADPVNKLSQFQIDIVDFLGINGEVYIPTFVNEFSGSVQLGWIDPIEVEQVFPDRHNRRIMRVIRMKPGAGAGYSAYYDLSVKREYNVINVDTNPRSKSFNYQIGDLFQFKINCAPDATRGRSDFEPVADLLDAWDQATFNDLERVGLLLNFIWDVELKGKSETEIQKWLETQVAPAPGSIRAHNENVKWDAVAPELRFTETRLLANGIRKDGLGAMDLGDFFFGITEGANRASSENLELPILKALSARQRIIKSLFGEMVNYVIDQAALKRPVIKRQIESGRLSRAFKIVMPELSTKDLSRVGSVVAQITVALDMAVERGWITRERAAHIFASFIVQFGIEYDVDEELKKATEDKEDEELKDYDKKPFPTINRDEEPKEKELVA